MWQTALSEHLEKVLAGLVALPYILYKVWQSLKSDRKEDNLDDRIESFSTRLQAELDKAYGKLDALRVERDKLADENATLKARITILENENLLLKKVLGKTSGQPTAA